MFWKLLFNNHGEVAQAETKPEAEVKPQVQVDLAELARQEWEAERSDESDAEEAPVEEKVDRPEETPTESDADRGKAEESKPAETAEQTKQPDGDDDTVISDWAIKHGLTVDEAREDLEKTKSIVQKFKTPEEMARALRLAQSERDKLKNEPKKPEADPYQVSENPQIEVYQYIRSNEQQLLEQFRNAYPARSRDMEDDQILEEISTRMLEGYTQFNEQRKQKVSVDAKVRREKLLAEIGEADKRFIPDVKAVLDNTNDRQVLSSSFNISDIIRWAKGGSYDKDIKAAEERGKKIAKEESRIVGIVPTAPKTQSGASKKSVSITEYEKRLARQMFGTTTMTDDEKYEAYIEVAKRGKKK